MEGPEGRPLGVSEIARRTGFALGTISQWLAIHRSPVLMEALASEKLDVGRAMKLAPLAVIAPEHLEEVVAEAATLSQPDVQRLVSAIRRRPEEVARRVASVNARRVMEAYRRLMLVDTVDAEVREALSLVARRVSELCRNPSLSEAIVSEAASRAEA